MRPSRLVNFFAGQKLNHDWFDVEHRCSIDGIEFGYEKLGTFDTNDAANGAADAIGSVLAALGKDAHGWP